ATGPVVNEDWGFETLAIHAAQEPDPTTGAVVVPVHLTTTYAQEGVGGHKGYEYSRTSNPTRTALEGCVAALENGAHALAFASGMAAEDAVLRELRPGADVVIHSSTKYLGGHSDVMGGIAVVRDDECHERIAFVRNAAGAVPGPFDCYLTLRGIKTLAVRMDRHCVNAAAVVELLHDHP